MKPQVGQIWKRHELDYLILITEVTDTYVSFEHYKQGYSYKHSEKLESFSDYFYPLTPLEQLL